MSRVNEFGQLIGPDLGDWRPPAFPEPVVLEGQMTRLEPLDAARHAAPLFDAYASAPPTLWTYMPFGPFGSVEDLAEAIERLLAYPDWRAFAVLEDGVALGFLSYLRIDPKVGVIEIGSIAYSPALQKTGPATEAIYLMLKHAFDLGYRRCEWKCDALNEPSRSAADRLGFRYEGTFLKAAHYKGRSRDTAWYAMTDEEWPSVGLALELWLAEDNFDALGHQRRPLSMIRSDLAS